MAVSSQISLLLSLISTVLARTTLLPCGSAYYYPSQYNCYNGNFLCPIISGQATIRCGTDCYLPSQYSCANNATLGPPNTSSTFTLVASAPGTDFDGLPIQASSGHFHVGGGAATYCPQFVPVAMCPAGNETVFLGSSLDVEVPGGQQIYLAPTGAISFTAAHSISYPVGSIFTSFDLNGGEASSFGGYKLFACPVANSPYQLVANITGVASNCKSLVVLSEAFTGGYGAWQYT